MSRLRLVIRNPAHIGILEDDDEDENDPVDLAPLESCSAQIITAFDVLRTRTAYDVLRTRTASDILRTRIASGLLRTRTASSLLRMRILRTRRKDSLTY